MRIASRFRGFLPVVVDVETGGINPATDALLEIAVVLLGYDEHGRLAPRATHALFREVRHAVRDSGCNRAILVGHNPILDLGFLNAAVERNAIKRNPFHPFSSFDTATLAGLAYGQTVLARAVQCAGLEWDQAQAHSAIYDAERTAEVFCAIVNEWDELKGDG
jgi:ribonuclease T